MPSKASRTPAAGWVPFLSPSLPYPHVYPRAASPAGRLAVQDRVHRLKVGAHGSTCEAWERSGAAQAARFGWMPPLYILLAHLPLTLDPVFQQSNHKNRKERSSAAPHRLALRHPPPPPPRVWEEDQPLASQAQKPPCAHLYHFYCIVTWLEMHNSCPVCCFQIPSMERVAPSEQDSPPTWITIRFAITPSATVLPTKMQLLLCCESSTV